MAPSEMTSRAHILPSQSDEWGTPKALLARLGRFDLDPAACDELHAAPAYYTEADDGLRLPWFGRVFLNPPYGHRGDLVARWLQKAQIELALGRAREVVALLPVKTGTAWWQDVVIPAERAGRARVEFLRGRLSYIRRDGTTLGIAPFASAVVVFT